MSSERIFQYCLNTSTIKVEKHSVDEAVRIAAAAGYDAIEPWVSELDAYTAAGGSLDDLGTLIADSGLEVENIIGFPEWVVDDDQRRAQGLEEFRRNLDMAQRIGAKRIAAPPWGAHEAESLDLWAAADRYRVLLEIADNSGVVPMLEFWGFSKHLRRFGEALFVAAETGRGDACILADIYHIYKGGGDAASLCLVGPSTLGLLHINDYPPDPPPETIEDADRVYPGDGVAPIPKILRDLYDAGYRGMLSLELFNESYYQQDPVEVAKTGLAKMDAVVAAMPDPA